MVAPESEASVTDIPIFILGTMFGILLHQLSLIHISQYEIIAVNMPRCVPPMTRRNERRRQAEPGQAVQISLETERLVSKRLDIVPYNGAAVDFAIRVNSLVFRKVVGRKSEHFDGAGRITGKRSRSGKPSGLK